MKKSERRLALVQFLKENPFATDEQLADHFSVSVATIRLDRTALHIPEARERIRSVAAGQTDPVRALEQQEIIGDLVELHLNRSAKSHLLVTQAHVFTRTGIVRGHILFAQVNSLAVAIMDADVAVTAKTELRYYRTVKLGDRLEAQVDVVDTRASVTKCRVGTTSSAGIVLDGFIWVASVPSGLDAFNKGVSS